MENKTKRDRLKEKRKAILDARLEKVKQRRMLKDGVILPDSTEPGKKYQGLPWVQNLWTFSMYMYSII